MGGNLTSTHARIETEYLDRDTPSGWRQCLRSVPDGVWALRPDPSISVPSCAEQSALPRLSRSRIKSRSTRRYERFLMKITRLERLVRIWKSKRTQMIRSVAGHTSIVIGQAVDAHEVSHRQLVKQGFHRSSTSSMGPQRNDDT